jgi:hypothetical protein
MLEAGSLVAGAHAARALGATANSAAQTSAIDDQRMSPT